MHQKHTSSKIPEREWPEFGFKLVWYQLLYKYVDSKILRLKLEHNRFIGEWGVCWMAKSVVNNRQNSMKNEIQNTWNSRYTCDMCMMGRQTEVDATYHLPQLCIHDPLKSFCYYERETNAWSFQMFIDRFRTYTNIHITYKRWFDETRVATKFRYHKNSILKFV